MFWSMTRPEVTEFLLKICWRQRNKALTGAERPCLFVVVCAIMNAIKLDFGGNSLAKAMKRISVIALLLTICFYVLYRITGYRVLFPLIITFGTITYHFAVRLAVGMSLDLIMDNKADYKKAWYQVSDFEMKLYNKLKVKQWKKKMPTYSEDTFDTSSHSWEEIIQATCQSELVHEINAVFSFFPVVASVWFGSFYVFLITSACGSGFDLMFVMMQRFNRTRILKMKRKRQK